MSQEVQKGEEEYYEWFDKAMGIENTALYNGIGYVEKYKVINNYHKFYKTTDFLKGSIVYDGHHYFGLEMKYDLDEDLVLLNLKKGLRIVLLQLIKSKVDSFIIDGHKFINIRDSLPNNPGISGFYEVLLENQHLKLFEKHKKKRFQKAGNNSVYYEFKSRNVMFLFYNQQYYPLRNRKELVKVFPEYKKEIEGLSKKKFPKSNTRDYLITLSNRISGLLAEDRKLVQ
nr:hypothetical protein [uncultured Allomuricauda sp.]